MRKLKRKPQPKIGSEVTGLQLDEVTEEFEHTEDPGTALPPGWASGGASNTPPQETTYGHGLVPELSGWHRRDTGTPGVGPVRPVFRFQPGGISWCCSGCGALTPPDPPANGVPGLRERQWRAHEVRGWSCEWRGRPRFLWIWCPDCQPHTLPVVRGAP